MPELLFELGCEEIPADDLLVLPEELKKRATQTFEANRLVASEIETHATPRRLVLRAQIELMQRDLREEKIGPPVRVAVDLNGNPSPAGLGFAKNVGLRFQKLKTIQTPKGEYLSAQIVVKGRPAPKVLAELLPAIVLQLPFNKFMRWGSGQFLFGRPIRNLLVLFDGKVVRVTIAGVSSGRYTFGHRFLGSGKKFTVTSYEDYRRKLQENGVVLALEDRIETIRRELHEQTAAAGGILREDPDLLRTMANEVEYPEVLSGGFPHEFLALPQEILINAMRKHQKYFCAVDSGSHLLPVFFTVLNTHAVNPELIRTGHERVLQARLRDAEFFWKEDRKTSLRARRTALRRLTYREKLGDYSQKIGRMTEIARRILSALNRPELEEVLSSLIQDCKADLQTLMVGEFPELQGIMAGLYARQEEYPEEQWQALYDQYQPVSAEDSTPRNFLGALLSLTDRIEILTSGYIMNQIPTGSRDPYALRRVATGAMKIVLEHRIDLDFKSLFEHAFSLYSIKGKLTPEEMSQGLHQLMEARFRFLMEQRGIAYDTLNAILNVEKRSFVDAFGKTNALWAKHYSEDLKTLARGFKRINNIISDQPEHPFSEETLQDDGEVRLCRAFSDLEFRVSQNIQQKDYMDALDIMVTLGPEIDNFFDEVLVMTEDPDLRNNRIALLQRISNLYRRIADFSALQMELGDL